MNLSRSKWRLASRTLWVLLTSHSSLLLRLMRPSVRPPRLRCWLFPLIYSPHLLVLLTTFGLHLFLQTYPYFPALYAVPVRRTKGLPTASFRFHLTMDTLAVQLCASSLPRRTRDFHPLEPAHGGRTKEGSILILPSSQKALKYSGKDMLLSILPPVFTGNCRTLFISRFRL